MRCFLWSLIPLAFAVVLLRGAEVQRLFLPPDPDTGAGTDMTLLVLGLICLAIAVGMVGYAALGGYQKQVVKKANALSGGNPEYILEQAGQLRETKPVCKGLWIGPNLVYLEQGAKSLLFEKKEVIWAYPQTIQKKVYGLIPLGKVHTLALRMMDGELAAFRMPEGEAREMVRTMGKLLPQCVMGYSEKLEGLYKQNRQQFAQIAAAQRGARR